MKDISVQSDHESSLKSSLFQSPRPTPKFLAEHTCTTFSQKKNRGPTPRRSHAPRPPLKSVPPVSRLFPNRTREEESRPRAVSFRQTQPSVLQSPHYDEQNRESYFNQCFEVVEKLGEGSFGEVYKVKCKEDYKLYAVKRSRERFKGEADKRRKLQEVQQHETLSKHPNCVMFHKAWAERGHLYIQTELCQMSLEEYSESHHDISESTVWSFLFDLIKGVKHLHDNDLLHLDIKPENIFVSMHGTCKLGDFGLTVQLGKNDLADAQEGDPRYLAPELLQGKFGKHADVFSIGITILELACDLDLPQNGQLWHQLRNSNIPWDVSKGISGSLKDVITTMMDPDYQQRPSLEGLLDLPIMRSVYRRHCVLFQLRKAWISLVAYLSIVLGMLVTVAYCVARTLRLPWGGATKSPPAHHRPQRPTDWDLSYSDDECFDTDVSHNSCALPLASLSFSSDEERSKVFTEPSSYPANAPGATPLLNRSCRRTPLQPRSSSPMCHGRLNTSFDRWTSNGSPNISAVHDDVEPALNLSFDDHQAINKMALEPRNLMQIFEDTDKI